MQQWEYRIEYVKDLLEFAEEEMHEYISDNLGLSDEEAARKRDERGWQKLKEKLDALGEEGWELVVIAELMAIFKRPVI